MVRSERLDRHEKDVSALIPRRFGLGLASRGSEKPERREEKEAGGALQVRLSCPSLPCSAQERLARRELRHGS